MISRRHGARTWAVVALLAGLMALTPSSTSDRRVAADSDGDGIPNCVERAGVRSARTGAIWYTDAANRDTDSDGVVDGEEVGAYSLPAGTTSPCGLSATDIQAYSALSDPTTADTDDDGLEDPYELSDGSSAFTSDIDSDGLSDDEERDWGSDPHLVDTDGDGFPDGEDVDNGFTPVDVDEKVGKTTMLREYGEGLFVGDFKDTDTVAQLVGSVSGGASSSLPVVGPAIGAVADTRDVVANAIDGDWVSAGYSAAGLVPYSGDVARSSQLLSKFIRKHPDQIRVIGKALAGLDKVPVSVRIRLVSVVNEVAVEQLRGQELSDEDILKFARRGADLAALAVTLSQAAGIIRGLASDNVDSEGFASSWRAAEEALRDYARRTDGTSDVADGPVYVGGYREPLFKGGRYIDSCTRCARLQPGVSRFRLAKSWSEHYSDTLQVQIDKDKVLAGQGYQVEWHFFAGRAGITMDPRVVDAVDQAGIPYYVHVPK